MASSSPQVFLPMPTYLMQTRGGTEGAESGTYHRFEPGDEIEAPEGEFEHLPDSAYETRPGQYNTRPVTPAEESGQNREYESKGAYKDFYEGGELVAENIRCKKEEAEAWTRGELTTQELNE